MTALNERMEQKPTKARPEIDGYIEKGGKFALSVTSDVVSKFRRTTQMRGRADRENGFTIIEGHFSAGVSRQRIGIIIAAVAFVGLVMIVNVKTFPGIITALLGAGLYIPLVGDYNNSEILLKELKKATKARDKPPTGD
jgi:hypothetical protein